MCGVRRAASIVLSLSLGACGNSPSAPPAPPPRADTLLGAAQYRCVQRDPVFVTQSSVRDVAPWIARGPTGHRLVAQRHSVDTGFDVFGLFMHDGADPIERPIALGAPGSVAWTGSIYLALVRDRIARYDAAFTREQSAHTPLPSPNCHAALVEGADGALAVWGRTTQGAGCFESVPWAQAFDASGAAVGPAFTLPLPVGAPRAAARWIRGRWDYGRFVVTAELAESGVWSWVLGPDGEVLGSAKDVVACARSGCVRVTASTELAADSVDATAQVLRVEPAARGGIASFATTTSAREVRGVVVSGDRVLVLHDTPSRSGCGLAVIDMARRTTVSQLQDDALTCAEAHVRPRARGFVYATVDTVRGAATRAIDCLE